MIRLLELGAVINDVFQRNSHFWLKGYWNSVLQLLLCFNLFVENSKSDVFKVSNGWDFFVEYYLLAHNIDQVPIFCQRWLVFFPKDLIGNPLSKGCDIIIIKDRKVSLFIFSHNWVDLPGLELLQSIDQKLWLEDWFLNLLHKLVLDLVRTFLEVDVAKESLLTFIVTALNNFLSIFIVLDRLWLNSPANRNTTVFFSSLLSWIWLKRLWFS
jgi:hypothetical protein